VNILLARGIKIP